MKHEIGEEVTIDTLDGRFRGCIEAATATTLPTLYLVRYRKDRRLSAVWVGETWINEVGND